MMKLKRIRIAVAAVMFVLVTLLFVGIGAHWWGWAARIQLVPAVLSLNVAALVLLALLTLLFGRVYCSVICPLGIFQDIISSFRPRRRFHFRKDPKVLRYAVLVLFAAALIAGLNVLAGLIDPYSAYGRMVQAAVSHSSWQLILVGAVTLLTIGLFAWLGGRLWCGSVCPVGTFLGLLGRFAIFKPSIDRDKCVKCGKCERECKASCIDSGNGEIDASRCVACYDCLETCALGAVRLSRSRAGRASQDGTDKGRRAFVATAALVSGSLALKAQDVKVDGGLAPIVPKQAPAREHRLVPPGAQGEKRFYDRCTGCQLCVSACSNGVLRPSTDLEHLMQPKMEYDKGWCRPECTDCSVVCPAGAILPVSADEKPLIHIGVARVDYDLCLAYKEGVSCGNCGEHCPSGAVRMVRKDPSDRDSVLIPTVLSDKCLGCGACEFLCPSRPISAITVDGRENHIVK